MQKTLDMKLTADEAARINSAIVECDKSIRRLFKEMDRDRVEIEKLKAETRTMLAEMKKAA